MDDLDDRREMDDRDGLDAGDLSSWLSSMAGALRGDHPSDVPCGTCTACCTAAQFIHIGPDETDALGHIPEALLFPAPRMPRGHVLLGYDERGHCPMLIDGQCSIYEHRPRTCRTYDCRVFPASGVQPGDGDQASIGRQALRWRFRYESPSAREEHQAVQAAARFLRQEADRFPEGLVPTNPTQLAVLAVEVHGAFLGRDGATGVVRLIEPDPALARDAIRERMAGARSGQGDR